MGNISLRFSSPEHGWLSVELSGPRGVVAFDASDVPGDSLAMLTDAACDLVDGRTPRTVTWFLEPEEYTLAFCTVGDLIDVWIRSESGLELHVGSDSPLEFCWTIWRALRRLQFEAAWQQPSERTWSNPFPVESCDYLRERLDASKTAG